LAEAAAVLIDRFVVINSHRKMATSAGAIQMISQHMMVVPANNQVAIMCHAQSWRSAAMAHDD
jgi:hypothetical protein